MCIGQPAQKQAMCLGQGVECGRLSRAATDQQAESPWEQQDLQADSPWKRQDLQDALFDAGVADELVDFHVGRERRTFSPRGGDAGSVALDAGLRDAGVRFMWELCQVVGLPPAAGFQAATLLDIASLRRDGGMPAKHLPLVCTAIVKLLKKADSATTFMSNASIVPHAQHMVMRLRKLGHRVPDATEDALGTQEDKLLVTLKWETQPLTIESWISIFVMRFNIITRGVHAAKLNQVLEQSMLCAQALVTGLSASPETPPLALARGLLGVSFVCLGLLPMEAAGGSATLGSLRAAVMACPEEMRVASKVAAAALQRVGGEVQAAAAAARGGA